jgi:hypothetical protein
MESHERADRLPHARRLREAIEGDCILAFDKKVSTVKLKKLLVVSTSGKPPLVDEGSALRCRQSHWHAPLSVQTAPHGQPVPPGAQLAKLAQLAQLPLEQVQLWPPLETWVPPRYERQLPCA